MDNLFLAVAGGLYVWKPEDTLAVILVVTACTINLIIWAVRRMIRNRNQRRSPPDAP
jgi:hypothetical protein